MFYDDGNMRNAGAADYARITDFVPGQDDLQLAAGKSYVSALGTLNGVSGLSIYRDVNANRKLDAKTDEMIAFVAGVRTLTDSDIIYSA